MDTAPSSGLGFRLCLGDEVPARSVLETASQGIWTMCITQSFHISGTLSLMVAPTITGEFSTGLPYPSSLGEEAIGGGHIVFSHSHAQRERESNGLSQGTRSSAKQLLTMTGTAYLSLSLLATTPDGLSPFMHLVN